MKKTLLSFAVLFGIVFIGINSAQALSTFLTVQGGTGTSTPSGILYGDNGSTSHLNTVTVGAGCTFSGGTLTCAGTGGAGAYPFQGANNSTSTLTQFLAGLTSYASTTIGASAPFNIGNNPSRMLISTTTSTTTLTVGAGEQYATIQAAVNQIPYFVNAPIRILVDNGTYNEDVIVQPSIATRLVGGSTIRVPIIIQGNTASPTSVVVHSFTINGAAQGSYIGLNGFAINGSTPYSPDDGELAGIAVFGVTDIGLNNDTFITSGVDGLLCYESNCMIENDVNFGTNVLTGAAIKAKRGGTYVDFDPGYALNAEGTVGTYAYEAQDSAIIDFNSNNSTLTGTTGLVYTGSNSKLGIVRDGGTGTWYGFNAIIPQPTNGDNLYENGNTAVINTTATTSLTNFLTTGGVFNVWGGEGTPTFPTFSVTANKVTVGAKDAVGNTSLVLQNRIGAIKMNLDSVAVSDDSYFINPLTFGSTSASQAQVDAVASTSAGILTLFRARNSSNASVFSVTSTGIASTTSLVVSNAGGTAGCATFGTDGTISNTGVACGTGSGSGFATTSADYWVTATTSLPSITTLLGLTTLKSSFSGLMGANSGVLYSFASSSLFGYTPLNPTRQLTLNGTANQITSSAGAQDLSADRTWTFSLPNHVIFPGNFQATNSTTTNATTTSLYIKGLTSVPLYVDGNGQVISAGTGVSGDCVKWGANNLLADQGSACGSGGGSSGGTWATTTSQVSGELINHPNNNTDVVTVGASATTSAPYYIDPNVTTGPQESIGSTTPFAMLSLHLLPTNTNMPFAFAIGSSTNSATSTLFSIDNTGLTTLTKISGAGLTSCSGGTNAVSWNSATNLFGCNTITGGGTGLSTTSPVSAGNVLVYSSTGGGSAFGVATGTVSAGSSAITVTAGRSVLGGALTIDCAGASASQNGCLSSTDWSTFNSKDSFAYPFINSATSSPLMLLASTTIGDGLNGLTVSGNATTTGFSKLLGNTTVGSTSASSFPLQLMSFSTGLTIPMELHNSNGNANSGVAIQFGNSTNISSVQAQLQAIRTNAPVSGDTALVFNTFNGNSGACCTTGPSERLRINGTGNIGVGSTSPYATLSVHANNLETNTTLFAIGSSTASATSTLFSIDNTGTITTNLTGTQCLHEISGVISGTGSDCGAGGGGAFSFTPLTNFGTTSNATTTPIWVQGNAVTPSFFASSTAVFNELYGYEQPQATSTAISVGLASSTAQLIRLGASATTITFSNYLLQPGMNLTLTTCNPGSTAGTLTFANAHFSGGVQPGNTTTANHCDMWFFQATMATGTTPIVVLTGMTSDPQ